MSGDDRKQEHIDLSEHKDAYVSMAQVSECKVCGARKDLRMGCCFPCSEFVEGIEIEGGHELWDRRNPEKRWKVRVQ